MPRKIVYNGSVDLRVDDLSAAEQQLEQVLQDHKAFLSHTDLKTAPGSPPTAQWTVRVPVEEFRAFMAAVRKLGRMQKSTTDSEDVTEEFYDVQDQIKNLKAEEESLRKLMGQAKTIADTLAVREQLSRVTRDTDRLQGRLKRLENLSALSTVVLNVRETKDYVPVETSFGASLGRVFRGSLDSMLTVGQGIVVVLVALTPWVVVLTAIGVPGWWLVRRRRRPPPVLPA